jgi:hypothetical protein
VVAEPACNDRVVHHRFVGFVFEVAVPARTEFGARPLVHHSEFFFGRTDLYTSFNPVGGKGPCTVDVPLLKDAFLHRWVTASKVVKGLDVRLCAIGGERETVVEYQLVMIFSRVSRPTSGPGS